MHNASRSVTTVGIGHEIRVSFIISLVVLSQVSGRKQEGEQFKQYCLVSGRSQTVHVGFVVGQLAL